MSLWITAYCCRPVGPLTAPVLKGAIEQEMPAWADWYSRISVTKSGNLLPLNYRLRKDALYDGLPAACRARVRGGVPIVVDLITDPDDLAKILKNQGWRALQPKSFVPRTTASRQRLGYSPNLLLDLTEPPCVNELGVGDITFVPLCGGACCSLAVLMDRYARNLVGGQLAETMTDELTLAALRMAIRDRQPPAQLGHHTDRGGPYASARYRAVLRRASMRQSMSRAADCYDNAFRESCFGTFKTELDMTE